jgi:hemoglobin
MAAPGTEQERADHHDDDPPTTRRHDMSTDVQQDAPATPSLYERIGGRATLERVVPTVMRNHLANPVVAERFRAAKTPLDELVALAVEFFATGLSGEPTYHGRSMPDTHAGMNITEAEYMAVLDDILAALAEHGIAPQEQAELLYIAYGLKSEIIGR